MVLGKFKKAIYTAETGTMWLFVEVLRNLLDRDCTARGHSAEKPSIEIKFTKPLDSKARNKVGQCPLQGGWASGSGAAGHGFNLESGSVLKYQTLL